MSDRGQLRSTRYKDRTRSLGHGVRWSFVNTVLTKLASIGITVVVVRLVSPHDFGVFAVALIAFTIVSALGELGLSACIARRDMDFAVSAPVVSTLAILSGTLWAALMWVMALRLATALGAPDAAPAIRVLSVGIFLNSLTAVSTAVLVRDFRHARLFAAQAISFLPSNGVLLVLALHGDGAMAFAWSRLVGIVVAGIFVVHSTRPWVLPGWDLSQARVILGFGLPLAGANLLNYMLINSDSAFIGALLGPAELGVYTIAFTVASWSTSILGGTINSVAMPALSALRQDALALIAALTRWLSMAAVIAFPIGALTAALSADLVRVLYGKQWTDAAPVLAILSLYGVIFVITLFLSNLLVAVGRSQKVLLIQAVWLASLVPTIAVGVQLAGVVGAAVAHVVVIVVAILPLYVWAVGPILGEARRLLVLPLLAPLGAAVVAGAAAWLVSLAANTPLLGLLCGGLTGFSCYVLVCMPTLVKVAPQRLERFTSSIVKPYAAAGRWVARSPGGPKCRR